MLALPPSSHNYSFYSQRELLFSLGLGLSKKRSFSSGGWYFGTIKDKTEKSHSSILSCKAKSYDTNISFLSISGLVVKTYENPIKSRELIRKDFHGKVCVYC